jgi:uncharacterized protein YkwD
VGSSPSVSHLIHFSAAAGDGGTPAPSDEIGLNLVTELAGVQARDVAECRLCTQLQIAFGAALLEACARAQFIGVQPPGHAPLQLTEARYWASSCGYEDPAESWRLFVDADYSETDGPILAIHFQTENLWPFFTWPGALIDYDPPLGPEEDAPEITLALVSLMRQIAGLDTQPLMLPMRLISTKVGETGETLLAELIYQDAPEFSGGGETVTCTLDPVWALAAKALAEVITEPGEYRLYWRIYKGDGAMRYSAACNDSTLGEFADDRDAGLGGGFGLDATTDLWVATLKAELTPLPFLAELAIGDRNLSADTLRETTEVVAFEQLWLGTTLDDAPLALTWQAGSGAIAAGGVVVHTATGGAVLAVAARPKEITLQDASTATVLELLMLVGTPTSSTLKVYGKELHLGTADDDDVLLATLPMVFDTEAISWQNQIALSRSFSFSQDASQLLAYIPSYTHPVSGDHQPGRVVTCAWETESAWTYTWAGRLGVQVDGNTREWDALIAAFWRADAVVTRTVTYRRTNVVNTATTYEGFEANTGLCAAITACLEGGGDPHFSDGFWCSGELQVALGPYADHYNEITVYDETYHQEAEVKEDGTTLETLTLVELNQLGTVTKHYRGRHYEAGNVCWEAPGGVEFIEQSGSAPTLGFERRYECPADTARPDLYLLCRLGQRNSVGGTTGYTYDDRVALFVDQTERAALDIHNDWDWSSGVQDFVTHTVTEVGYAAQTLADDVCCYLGASEAYGTGSAATIRVNDTAHIADTAAQHLACITPNACVVAQDPEQARDPGDAASRPTASALIAAHNTYRASQGLGEVTSNAQLSAAIAEHLSWLKSQGTTLSHTGEGGTTPLERALAAGYQGTTTTHVVENLALYPATVEAVMSSWIASPVHQANLVDPDVVDIGVSILEHVPGQYWWGVVMGYKD